MIAVHVSPELQQQSWNGQWQRVALWYRVRDYAAVMDAVYAVNIDHLITLEDDWMLKAQSVSPKQATLLKLFSPHPEDMEFCEDSSQITVFPVRELRELVRCLHDQTLCAPRALIGRLTLDLADPPTLAALCIVLENAFGITRPIRHPVLLDVA